MMDYLSNLFGGGNAVGGMRRPPVGQGMDLYGGQPSMNLGMTMPRNTYADSATGTGMMPPSSFGQMPTGFSMNNPKLAMALLDAGKPQAAPMPQVQMPMGSNQSYEQLMKMYGVRGLLG
jgi:hypothetical protein